MNVPEFKVLKTSGSGPLFLSLVVLQVGMVWLDIALMQDFDFHGRSKGILLLLIGAAGPALVSVTESTTQGRRFATGRYLWALGAAAFVLVAMLFFAKRRTQIEFAAIALLSALPLVLRYVVRRPFAGNPLPNILILILGICIAFNALETFAYINDTEFPSDIALATQSSIGLVKAGQNPYVAPVDFHPEYPDFAGFKYPPLMMAIYEPLSSLSGQLGLRLTNLLLYVLTSASIFLVAWRIGGLVAGLCALCIYLALPEIPADIYAHAVTDIAPALPLVIAVLLVGHRPGLAGMLIGFSMATKLFPGALVAICCLPRRDIARYAMGCGAVFTVAVSGFVIWDPRAFFQNVFVFIFARSPDVTSALNGLPRIVPSIARLLFITLLLTVIIQNLRAGSTVLRRCGWIVACCVAAVVTGPDIHNNYIIWWAPFICILLACQFSALLRFEPVQFQTASPELSSS